MRRFTLIILLFLGTVCQAAAIKYVATTGVDTPAGGSIESPWLTIQYAISKISTGDTIKVAAGSYYEAASNYLNLNRAITATIESQSGLKDVFIKPSSFGSILRISTAAGNYTLNNLTFIPQGASCRELIDGSVDNYSLTCNNCVFDMNGLAGTFLVSGTGTVGENLSFNNCTMSATNVNNDQGMFVIRSFNVIEVNNCTITKNGGNWPVFRWLEDSNTLKITGNNVTLTDASNFFTASEAATTDDLNHLVINNNTVTNCKVFFFVFDADIHFAEACNNTITTSVETLDSPFYIGHPGFATVNTFSGYVIRNNTVTMPDANDAWCVMLGPNCYGFEVAYNTFISNRNNNRRGGICIEGCYNNIHHNFIKSKDTLRLSGGRYNKFQYNTCYVIGQRGVYWSNSQGGNIPQRNIITNNIFDASGGGVWAVGSSDDVITDPCDNYINYNCYNAGSSGVARLDGTTYNTIAAMTAKWKAWSDVWPGNDANSIIADPQFMNAANEDFRLKSTSPCLNTGESSLYSGKTTIGAWQPNAKQ